MPQPLADLAEPLNVLYYGDGGTGKTTAATAMAHLGKVLVVNAESGVKRKPLSDRGIPVKNIEVFPGKGEELSYDGLEEQWQLILESGKYVGVVFDSITELQQALKDQAVQASIAKANRMGRERNRFVVDQDNWREVNEQCRLLIRKYRDLPCHFALTALARREQDSDGAVAYQPGVTPGIQSDLIGWMDVVCHTSVAIVDGDEEFRGLFRAAGKYRGKDRNNAVPRWLVDPTFDRVWGYTEGKIKEGTDAVMKAARERAIRAKNADGAESVEKAA